MDTTHTRQLKGLAILLIVLGHLWTHVAEQSALFNFAGYGVAMFFLLSGYGLTISTPERTLFTVNYFRRRLTRIFLPYWLATFIIIILDFVFMQRVIPLDALIYTSFGINITSITSHLDYSRWFITLLLLWYSIHYLISYYFNLSTGLMLRFACAFVLFAGDYYIVDVGWYQVFAFPAGCMLATYRHSCRELFSKYHNRAILLSLFVLAGIITPKIVFSCVTWEYIPDIIWALGSELESILFCAGLIILFGAGNTVNRYSLFLYSLGGMSYEIFLLHGSFLIKYNPVIFSGQTCRLSLQFYLYLALLLITSFFFQKMIPSSR